MAMAFSRALHPFPVEPRLAAAAVDLERAVLTDRVGPAEDPVLPCREAPVDAGLHRLAPADAQVRLHAGQRVGREARALLEREAHFVVPVDVVGCGGDEAQ